MEKNKSVKRVNNILGLTWPIFIELVLQMLVGNADQIMVGWYDPDLVGAIGNANQIVNLLLIVFSVICTAATILISQYLGAKSTDRLRETYTVSLLANLIFGLMVSAILVFLCGPIYRLMNVPDEIFDEAVLYIRIIGAGMVFQAVYLTFTAFFRSCQLMKQTMLVSVLVNIINIGCNALLINGLFGLPALGVAGAAISSGLSRIIGVVVIALLFRKYFGKGAISASCLKPFPKTQFRGLLHIGLPSGGESISYNLSQICIQAVCNRFELFVINTRVYANMFAMLSYMFASAVAQAAQVVVARYMGGGRHRGHRQMRKTHNVCLRHYLRPGLRSALAVCRASVRHLYQRRASYRTCQDNNVYRDTAGAGQSGQHSHVPRPSGLRRHPLPDNHLRHKRLAHRFGRRHSALRAAWPRPGRYLDRHGLRRVPARRALPLALAHPHLEPHPPCSGVQLIKRKMPANRPAFFS